MVRLKTVKTLFLSRCVCLICDHGRDFFVIMNEKGVPPSDLYYHATNVSNLLEVGSRDPLATTLGLSNT